MSKCCDKCGREVLDHNNAINLDIELFGTDINLAMMSPRHLFPIVENGTVVCEGSPSRVHRLVGQVKDPNLLSRDLSATIPCEAGKP